MHWRRKEMPTGKIGTYLEILGAIAALSDKKEFENKEKKKFLTKRLFDINRELSALLRQVIPEL